MLKSPCIHNQIKTMAEVKFYSTSFSGIQVTNGKNVTIKFVRKVYATSNQDEIDVLAKCESVKEVTKDEAMEIEPSLNVPESAEQDPLAEKSKNELIAMATELGATEEELKNAKSKSDVIALVKQKQQK